MRLGLCFGPDAHKHHAVGRHCRRKCFVEYAHVPLAPEIAHALWTAELQVGPGHGDPGLSGADIE